jgi:hypothetical protein
VTPLYPGSNFSLEETWTTLNDALRETNRQWALRPEVNAAAIQAARQTMDPARRLCGNLPVRVHSWARCPELQGATPGHSLSKYAEHLAGGAVDCDVVGQPLDVSFQLLLEAARRGEFKFNQLIIEEAKGRFGPGVARWLHVSDFAPERLPTDRRGLAMKMRVGADGKEIWEVVQKFEFSAAT